MQHPDLTYASATTLQAARQQAAETRRRARRAQAPIDEELPAQFLLLWQHLAGRAHRLPAEPALEALGMPARERSTAPASSDAA